MKRNTKNASEYKSIIEPVDVILFTKIPIVLQEGQPPLPGDAEHGVVRQIQEKVCRKFSVCI
jgi:dihydrofolate reductase